MPILVGEPHDLVFDRWTIARPTRLNLPGVHRRAMQIGADQFVDCFVCIGDPARNLRRRERIGEERKRLRIIVARLKFGLRIVDRAAVEPGRCARLEPPQFEAESLKRTADPCGRPFAGPAAGRLCLARVHDGLQKCAGSENHGTSAIDGIAAHANADHPRPLTAVFDQQVLDRLLPQHEVWLFLDDPLHLELIKLLVGLGPRAVHRRAFAAIEQPKLNAGGVDRAAHRPAEGIDLTNNLPLGDAADRRIAAHLCNRVAISGQQRRPRPQPRCSQRRLGPGMPGADDEKIVVVN